MKILFHTHPWKLGKEFAVENEKGDPVIKVSGNFFSKRQKMQLSDEFGIPLGKIEKKLFSIQPVYTIYRENRKRAIVKRIWTLFRKKIVVITTDGDLLKVKGNFEDYEYSIYQDNKRIAVVSKKLFKWPNTYGLLVPSENDPVLFISIVIAMDLLYSLKVRM